MSAPYCRHTSCGETDVAERLRHLAALLVEHEAVGQHRLEGRARLAPTDFEQRGMEPAAMLVGALEVQLGRPLQPGVAPARWHGSSRSRTRHPRCPRPSRSRPESASAQEPLRVGRVPGVGALALEGPGDALHHPRVAQRLARRRFDTNTAIGTPQARWRETHQSGRLSIIERMPVACRDRARSGSSSIAASALSRRWSAPIHRDEPLRGGAEDQRRLGAPGMRVAVDSLPRASRVPRSISARDHRLGRLEHVQALEARRLRRCRCRPRPPCPAPRGHARAPSSKSSSPWLGAMWTKPVPCSVVTKSPAAAARRSRSRRHAAQADGAQSLPASSAPSNTRQRCDGSRMPALRPNSARALSGDDQPLARRAPWRRPRRSSTLDQA